MTKKKSIFAFALAACLAVPAMFMLSACGKHEHSFSSEWSQSETQHWHECTDKKCNEKQDLAEHEFVWEVKTPAGVHVDKVEEGTCSKCNFKKERTVPNTATHTYETASWEKDATGHWHKSTCDATEPAHQGLKADFAEHTYGAWTVKTLAEFHKNSIEHRLCSVCGFEETQEVLDSMTHTWEWKANNAKHWQETTCEHETPLKQNEQDHTWVYASEGELTHRRTTNCGAEKHATRIEPNIPHRYTDVNDVDCNDCGYVRSLTEKGSFNALSPKTYNASAQPVASSDYTVNEAIKGLCEIQYKVKGANDSTYTTTAPTNAGTYEVRIFCNGNDTYLKGEVAKTDYVIKQIEVKVGISFIKEKQTTSNNYITLETYEVTNPSLPSNVTLTLRAYGEQYKNQGRYSIAKTNGEFEGLEFDNKNFKPIPNKSTLSISIVVYTNEAPVVTGTNQTESNVNWIGYATPPYPTITMYQITTGTLRVGDYLICEGVNIPLKVKDIKLNKGSVSGSTSSSCLNIALAGETVDISFETPGFTENDAKTKLLNKTFTKVDYEVLKVQTSLSGKNYTNNSSEKLLNVGECRYLEFTVTIIQSTTFTIYPSDYAGGYAGENAYAVFDKTTGKPIATAGVNTFTLSESGTYTLVLKLTKTAEASASVSSKPISFYVSW